MGSMAKMIAAALALIAIPVVAQQVVPLTPRPVEAPVAATTASPVTIAQPQISAQDLNAWLDGYMPYALATGDIAGAVVVVVKDGRVVTQRGYGYSDVAARKPVDPAATLFRPGSISKLFTWTAVMQLVEQGKLDLDRDVNGYLDFTIPPHDGKPITLRNLMQHTAGFEEAGKYIMFYDQSKLMPLGDYLKRWVPERIYSPGTTPAYSNYGTALAGYIVARSSGLSFDDYIDRNIFNPLGMANSTFRQPLPKRFVSMMSKGYPAASAAARPYEIVGPAPAGSLASTGADMARFMIAHLQKGAFGSGRILQPRTAELMHNSPLTIIPGLNRMELGFFETNINGRQVIAHLGDTQDFHSALHLFLDENTGLYISFNSLGKNGAAGTLRGALFDDFADRYFPGPRSNQRLDPKIAASHAALVAGTWVNSRRSASNFFNLTELFSQLQIGAGPDGELSVPAFTGPNDGPRKWTAIAPFVWQDADGHEKLAAKLVDGKVVHLSIDGISPFMIYSRAPWYKDSAWLMPLLYASLAAILLTVILWPVSAIVRRRFAAPLALDRRGLWAHRLVRIAGLATLVTLVGWAVLVSMMTASIDNLTGGLDPLIWTLEIASLIIFVGGLAIALWHLWVVWSGKRRWQAKLWSVVLALAALIVLWVGLVFHLISFGVNY